MKRTTRAVQEACEEESDFENIDLSDIEDKSDESVSNDSKPKYVSTGQKITYSEKIIESKNAYKRFKKITKENFDRYDFNKSTFIEQLIHYKDQPLYVHLFFDIDDIKDTDEYEEFIKWLDSLKPVFGDYSIGGYCNKEEMAAFGYKLIATATKYASLHVAFYQTAIDADEIRLLGRKSTKGMWPKIDESIYTIQNPKNDTQKQAMRFVLSNKMYGPGDPKNAETAGVILDGKLPHMCTYQVWGGERIVPREEWSKIFTIAEEEKPKGNTEKTTVKKTTKLANKTHEIENLELYANPDYVVPVDEDVVLELLNEFEPTHAWLEQIGCLLLHSPFDKETVYKLLKDWYFQEGTDHHNKNTVDAYVDKYYEREYTNRWLFSIIKKIPDDKQRDKWFSEFNSKGIDPNVKIDLEDDFSITQLAKIDYARADGKGIDAMRFMNDLKKVAALIESEDGNTLIALKCYCGLKDVYQIAYITEDQFIKKLKMMNVGSYYKNGKLKDCNAFAIYSKGKNRTSLMCKGIKFYSPDPDMFSYFRGYDYKELDDYNEDVISAYLNHIRENIANGNEELYNYILNWVSYILQNPGKKTGSCLVITGGQGTGKNTFTNVICNLMKRYSVSNLTNIGDLIGKYNIAIENNKLVVCNEMSSADSNIYMNADLLKTVITENEIAVENKYVARHYVQNVVNLIILSNHFDPVKVEKDDRRYVVCDTNELHKNDRKYFGAILDTFTEEFYQNLFTFFMKRNLDGVDLMKFPETEVKHALLEVDKSPYEGFIQDFIIDFLNGFIIEESYIYYNKWAYINGYIDSKKKVQKDVYAKGIQPYITITQKRFPGGTRKRLYKLKEDQKKYFVLDKYEKIDAVREEEEEDENNEMIESNEEYEDFKADVFRKCKYF